MDTHTGSVTIPCMSGKGSPTVVSSRRRWPLGRAQSLGETLRGEEGMASQAEGAAQAKAQRQITSEFFCGQWCST